MMEEFIKPVMEFATAYIDNIIISTEADENEDLLKKHYQHVCKVLQLCLDQQLYVDIDKIELFLTRWSYVGIYWGRGNTVPPRGD